MKLASNWRELWKKYSTIALALITAIPPVWAASTDFQALIPAPYMLKIVTFVAVIGLIGRYIDQTKKNLETKDGNASSDD